MPNWSDVLDEIAHEQYRAQRAFDFIRYKYLRKLTEYTGRNIISYYSAWQSKPGVSGVDIRDEDKNGFMTAVHELDCDQGLDLLLHTPGGSISATQSIVTYLREKFGRDIRVFIPQMAMSGGTVMACSSRQIVMARHSSIGPIDPQIRGVPAKGVLDEFETAYQEISADPNRAVVWRPILEKYTPTFLGQCQNAIDWSEKFARQQLSQNMFFRKKNKTVRIDKIIDELTEYKKVKTHERQIDYREAKNMGLVVRLLESDQELQDLVLTVHHCYMHSLSNSAALKIIENHRGISFMKHMQQ